MTYQWKMMSALALTFSTHRKLWMWICRASLGCKISICGGWASLCVWKLEKEVSTVMAKENVPLVSLIFGSGKQIHITPGLSMFNLDTNILEERLSHAYIYN